MKTSLRVARAEAILHEIRREPRAMDKLYRMAKWKHSMTRRQVDTAIDDLAELGLVRLDLDQWFGIYAIATNKEQAA